MRKLLALILILALGCLTGAGGVEKEQRYIFYYKNPGGEGTLSISAKGNLTEARMDEATLKFNRITGGLISYNSKTKTGYMDLQFENNKVSVFEQGYANGKATYYYEKNGTRVVYYSQDKKTDSYLNFTPKQEALSDPLLQTSKAYASFFAKPDAKYRTGNRIIGGYGCDTYETGSETERREVCYSEITGSIVLDAAYSRLNGVETEMARSELRSYLEG